VLASGRLGPTVTHECDILGKKIYILTKKSDGDLVGNAQRAVNVLTQVFGTVRV
jgi:hypothetical protein